MAATAAMMPMMAMMAMSTAQSISGAYSQSQAMKSQGAYSASVGRINARLANLSGSVALREGDIAASARVMGSDREVAAAKVGYAAQGVDLSSGSARSVIAATQEMGAVDEMTIRNNAMRKAWGYKVQALSDTARGEFAQMGDDVAARQTLITGGMKAVSGPLSIYANYKRFDRYNKMATPEAPVDDFYGTEMS